MAQNTGNAYEIGNGDIKYSSPIEGVNKFFPDAIEDREREIQKMKSAPSKPLCSGFGKKEQKISKPEENALCHHAFEQGVSADELHIVFANHSVDRCRATLASINQIVYHLCRQSVTGRVSASILSGFVRGGVIALRDSVAYSCHWAAQQMAKWWGDAMSATTFRRIRDDLEGLGCFRYDRVGSGSTRQVTNLHEVDLPQLLRVAAVLIERLSAEPDGFILLMPGHRVGFLASLWRHYFKGTIYSPDSESRERSIDSAQFELARAEQLAIEHSWSEYLSAVYRAQVDHLKRNVRNLRDRTRAAKADCRLFQELLPF
jgi:hypothetical protein